MKILSFGSLNIDHVYQLPHNILSGETLAATQLEQFPGGKGFNQCSALARSGADAYMAGQIGHEGRFMLDFLQSCGADTSAVREVDAPNGHAIIQIDPQGGNSIIIYGGANRLFDEDFIRETLAQFDAGDMVLLQNEVNLLAFIMGEAKRRGLIVALNPSPIDAALDSLDYSLCDYLIVNEIEGHALSGEHEAGAILHALEKKYPRCHVILTLGSEGSCCLIDGKVHHQDIFPTTVVDTTAAGDTFAAYLLSSVAGGHSIAEAMRIASAASAITVSRKGAAVSVPTMDEVKRKLAESAQS